ncbi:MAG: type II secretion system protein [Clostridia bacterium]|nr:type II secretion system protein [Clostridia bacterium]
MFNFMLKHKKGFTLVELIIVIALMGFGAVAIANLFQSAFRTFTKSEERYIKQEAVKTVAEYLQHSLKIGAATKAEIYPDSRVVPTVAGSDSSFAYIYVEKSDMNEDGNIDGYYLYLLDRGKAKENAVCLNKEIPLYITFSAYQDYDFNGDSAPRNQCGVKVNIAAVDSDYQYKTTEELENLGVTEEEDISDYIFYNTVVSYHFPNMVNSIEKKRVNSPVYDEYDNIVERDVANEYDENGIVTSDAPIDSVDVDGHVLRVAVDSLINADATNNALSVASFCFIATAGYGEATGEVGILCDFRDQCLKTNPLGRMFVKAYYTISPPIADFISESEPLKAVTRVALKPLVAFAVYALEPDLLIEQIPFILMGAGSVVGVVVVGVHAHKRKVEE